MSSSEINFLIDSLITPKKENKTFSFDTSDSSTKRQKTIKNSKNQLTPMTKSMIEKKERLQSSLTINDLTSSDYSQKRSHINSHSQNIADGILHQKIKDIFNSAFELSKQQVEDIFHQLGILDRNEKINDRAVFRETLKMWELDENIFDAIAIQNEIFQAVNGDTNTKFRKIVRNKINIYLSNKKSPKLPYVREEKYIGSHVLSWDVFDRLCAPISQTSEEKEEEIPKEFEYSKYSKRILNNSGFANSDFSTRTEYYTNRKIYEQKKLKSEIQQERNPKKMENKSEIRPISNHLSPDKPKNVESPITNNSPKFYCSYDEYCQYRDKLNERHSNEKSLPGWNSHYNRMNKAQNQKIQKERDDEHYSHLNLPIIKYRPPKQIKDEDKTDVYYIQYPQNRFHIEPIRKKKVNKSKTKMGNDKSGKT